MPKPTAKDAAGGKDRWGAPSLSPTDILRGAAGRSLGHCQGGGARPRLGPRRTILYPQVPARGHPLPVLQQSPCGVPDTGTRGCRTRAQAGKAGEDLGKHGRRTTEVLSASLQDAARARRTLERRGPETPAGGPRTPALVPGIPAASNARPSALPASQSASAASPSYDERHSALCFLCFLPMATAPRAAASPAAPWPPSPGPGSPPALPRSLRDRAGSGRRDRK